MEFNLISFSNVSYSDVDKVDNRQLALELMGDKKILKNEFLLISYHSLETRKDWKSLFKKFKRIRVRDFPEKSRVEIEDILYRSIDAIVDSITEVPYENIRYSKTFNHNLSVSRVDNWQELLKDKGSWLYTSIHNEIYKDVIEQFSFITSNVKGSVSCNIEFHLEDNDLLAIGMNKSLSDFIDASVDIYINKIIEEFMKEEDLHIYIISVSEKKTKKSYSVEGAFLARYWDKVIDSHVDFFRFYDS